MNKEKILLCGREFTQKELDDVIETVKMFKNLSRTELALTICDHLEWYTSSGKYKQKSAYKLLIKLEAEGKFQLPDKKDRNKIHAKLGKAKITFRTDPQKELSGKVSNFYPIKLELIKNKSERLLWNEYVERYHVLGYKRPFGARQRYFITGMVNNKEKILGCNLASKALSLAAKQIRDNWKERYNYEPVLLETFVDEERYSGTCYQASNWICLGRTKGRGRQDRYNEKLSSPKLIYVYPLVEDFRSYLKGERSDWGLK